MSFRARLSLFFVAIVIVPMVSLALVLFRLIEDNEGSKADARTAAGQQVVRALYADATDEAERAAMRVGADPALAASLRAGDRAGARIAARRLLDTAGVTRIRIADRRGRELIDLGRPDAVAPTSRRLEVRRGVPFGDLQVATRSAPDFARQARRLTGLEVVVRTGRRSLAATVRNVPEEVLPRVGTVEAGGRPYRVATFADRGFGRDRLRVAVLDRREQVAANIGRSRLIAGGLLLGFFLIALVCAVLVSRQLQRQIGAFLTAARKIGRGDFRAQVPIEGRDEFAALGGEFNHMARELEARLAELARQRGRLQTTVRRVGEAFAAGLDRRGLLGLTVSTMVDGVVADGGRARAGADGAASGEPGGLEDVVRAAERQAEESGEPHDVRTAAGAALAHPLRAGSHGTVHGTVSVWRRGRPFLDAERELFHYLAASAGVSLDNVALHEAARRQAVTDELTGLANHRSFQEALGREIERARRFEQGVGLVLVDLDDFKAINDTYGHQTGDRVLAEVARVLREQSRDIDVAARYGGEELAVVLPGAGSEGAHGLAERVRAAIASLRVPVGEGRAPLRVTASFGVAALPESANDKAGLVAAADAALYDAKRSGKNRTVTAGRLPLHGTAR